MKARLPFLVLISASALPFAASSGAWAKGVSAQFLLQTTETRDSSTGKVDALDSLTGNFNIKLNQFIDLQGQDIGLNVRTDLKRSEKVKTNQTFSSYRVSWNSLDYSLGANYSQNETVDESGDADVGKVDDNFNMNFSMRPDVPYLSGVTVNYQKKDSSTVDGAYVNGNEGLQMATHYVFGQINVLYAQTRRIARDAGSPGGLKERESVSEGANASYSSEVGDALKFDLLYNIDQRQELGDVASSKKVGTQSLNGSASYQPTKSLNLSSAYSNQKDLSDINPANKSSLVAYESGFRKSFGARMNALGSFRVQKPSLAGSQIPKTSNASVNFNILPDQWTFISMNVNRSSVDSPTQNSSGTAYSYSYKRQFSPAFEYLVNYTKSINRGSQGWSSSVGRNHTFNAYLLTEPNLQAFSSLGLASSTSYSEITQSNHITTANFNLNWQVDNDTSLLYSSMISNGSGKTVNDNFSGSLSMTRRLGQGTGLTLRYSQTRNKSGGAAGTASGNDSNDLFFSLDTSVDRDSRIQFNYQAIRSKTDKTIDTKMFSLNYNSEL